MISCTFVLSQKLTATNKRVYDAHFFEINIIVFAPCRLPQEKIGLLIGGKLHGVNTPDVMCNGG
jgi:hypothetical protein